MYIDEIRMKNTTTVQHTIESRRNSSINFNLGKKNKMAKLEGGSTKSNKMDRQINNSERKTRYDYLYCSHSNWYFVLSIPIVICLCWYFSVYQNLPFSLLKRYFMLQSDCVGYQEYSALHCSLSPISYISLVVFCP
jgi:hypothetical protein